MVGSILNVCRTSQHDNSDTRQSVHHRPKSFLRIIYTGKSTLFAGVARLPLVVIINAKYCLIRNEEQLPACFPNLRMQGDNFIIYTHPGVISTTTICNFLLL